MTICIENGVRKKQNSYISVLLLSCTRKSTFIWYMTTLVNSLCVALQRFPWWRQYLRHLNSLGKWRNKIKKMCQTIVSDRIYMFHRPIVCDEQKVHCFRFHLIRRKWNQSCFLLEYAASSNGFSELRRIAIRNTPSVTIMICFATGGGRVWVRTGHTH